MLQRPVVTISGFGIVILDFYTYFKVIVLINAGCHNIRLWGLLIYISIPTSSYRFIERRMLQYRASALFPYISIPTSKLLFKQRHMLKYPALP